MKLGTPEISLAVRSLEDSIAFYQALGFRRVEGEESEGWLVLEHGGVRIGLYQGQITRNSLTFFGGDVQGIAETLAGAGYDMKEPPAKEEDGSTGATVEDPDGNLLYFNS